MELQRYVGGNLNFDPSWMESIILQLGDLFEIRISWNKETAIVTGVCALVGGAVGSYAGGRLGAAVGAGLAGAAGLGVSTMISLREAWNTVKEKLQELLYIVFNYLRRLDAVDYMHAYDILMACQDSRRELVLTILEFIVVKLGREVISNITE